MHPAISVIFFTVTSGAGGIFERVATNDGQRQCDKQCEEFAAHGLQVGDGEGEQADDEGAEGNEDAAGFESEYEGINERTAGRFVGDQVHDIFLSMEMVDIRFQMGVGCGRLVVVGR